MLYIRNKAEDRRCCSIYCVVWRDICANDHLLPASDRGKHSKIICTDHADMCDLGGPLQGVLVEPL